MDGEELLKAHYCAEDIDPRSENYSKMRKSVFLALERMIIELDQLAPFFGYTPGDLEIRVFEGLRDMATQKELFDTCLAGILKNNPEISQEAAYQETSKWISPYINNVPTHTTGAAIDMHLFNNTTNSFCNMGRFNRGIVGPTFMHHNSLTEEQCNNNRLLFLMAATKADLTNYVYEFWHDSMVKIDAAYWRETNPELCIAIYNSL